MMSTASTTHTSSSNTIDILDTFDKDLIQREYLDRKPFLLRGDVTTKWPCRHWTFDFLEQSCGNTVWYVHCYERKNVYDTYFLSIVKSSHKMRLKDFFSKYFDKQQDKGGAKWSIKECDQVFRDNPTLAEQCSFEEVSLGDREGKKFLWIGNQASCTGLHVDLAGWNLNLQVVGKKHWKFYAPSDSQYMYMETNKEGISGGLYSPVDPFNPDRNEHPDFAKVTEYEIFTEPGDLLYVPDGWWHAVYSLTPTISVNYVELDDDYGQFSSEITDYVQVGQIILKHLARKACRDLQNMWTFVVSTTMTARKMGPYETEKSK